jgi:hypothetical protein
VPLIGRGTGEPIALGHSRAWSGFSKARGRSAWASPEDRGTRSGARALLVGRARRILSAVCEIDEENQACVSSCHVFACPVPICLTLSRRYTG